MNGAVTARLKAPLLKEFNKYFGKPAVCPALGWALKSSSRKHSPCRPCSAGAYLVCKSVGPRMYPLCPGERVSPHFLLHFPLILGLDPGGNGDVHRQGCSLNILGQPLPTNAKPVQGRVPWLNSLEGISCHTKTVATGYFQKWLLSEEATARWPSFS